MYLHRRTVADAALASGIRACSPRGSSTCPARPRTWQAGPGRRRPRPRRLPRPGGPAARGPRAPLRLRLPAEGLSATARIAAELGALVQIHVAETAAEDARTIAAAAAPGCRAPRRSGARRPLDLAGRRRPRPLRPPRRGRGPLSAEQRQARQRAWPGVADMLALGIRVGLGTDGPASNDDLDLWEEMRLAPLLARASASDAALVPSATALRLATRGGAEALGLATGSLEAGRSADFVRLRPGDPSFVPALDEPRAAGPPGVGRPQPAGDRRLGGRAGRWWSTGAAPPSTSTRRGARSAARARRIRDWGR